jgi:NAD(P)-dependent dehydrogenase (short-subunit alcohol dehydrogenase family)
MVKRQAGRLKPEKMGSTAAREGLSVVRDDWAAYPASTAGIEGLAKHFTGRSGEHGPRVNVVRPPGTHPHRQAEVLLGEDGLFWSHYQNIQSLKRHGRAEDVAAAVAFLASDEAAFITAAVLDVGGGTVARL